MKFLKRLLTGASRGLNIRRHVVQYSTFTFTRSTNFACATDETKPLIKLIAGVIFRLICEGEGGEGWGCSKGEG